MDRTASVSRARATALGASLLLLWACSGGGGATPSAGTRAPPSNLSATNVLIYGVGHRDGSVSFMVRSDGAAEFSERNPEVGDKQVRATVKPEELKALANVLRQNRFCDLESDRSEGVPDEARPSIAVRLEDIDCKVELWDNEFREDPRAKACLKAVEDLARVVAGRGE